MIKTFGQNSEGTDIRLHKKTSFTPLKLSEKAITMVHEEKKANIKFIKVKRCHRLTILKPLQAAHFQPSSYVLLT